MASNASRRVHPLMAVDLRFERPRRTLRLGLCGVLVAGVLTGCALTTAFDRPPRIEEIASLDDARLAPTGEQVARSRGEARRAPVAGAYILEPFDPDRTPVLFIHGVNGAPRDFHYLIERLDRARFQAWLFYYPSGAGLRESTEQLQDVIDEVDARYGVRSLAIVAYSMGGLIARDLLVRRAYAARPAIPLLITLSTPWDGHAGAGFGARLAIAPPPSWRDMAPGSAYLTSLFGDERGAQRIMPDETQHHLLFSYRKGRVSIGASGDEVVSLASQLLEPAQAQAARIYGFDVTHTGILHDDAVAALVDQLLDSSRTDARMAAASAARAVQEAAGR